MAVACAVLWALGCHRAARSSAGAPAEGDGDEQAAEASAPMDGSEAAQWAAAAQGDPEELMRLQDLVGCEGLRDRAAQRELRATAIRAMGYCPDMSELPWLVAIADGGDDVEARAALEAIDEIAARPRRATDPEDAEELHAGCAGLLAIARAPSRPRLRRALAVRALRMLADRGCVRASDIPATLEPK